MKKKCQRCNKTYTQKSGKGSTRAKYCYKCRPLVRKEQMKKSESKRFEFENPIAQDDQVLYYGYKEPLKKYEKGFGYIGVVSYSKEKDKVQCHICGRMFRNVGSHSALNHKISAEKYKEMIGLGQNTALVGEGTRTLLITAHKDIPSFSQKGKSKKQIVSHMKKMSKNGVTKGKGSRKSSWTLERRNEEGLCPDQLIDRIIKLTEKLGERPTAKQYAEEYGSFSSIITVYGTWNKALEIAGIDTYTKEKGMRSDPQYLLENMRMFYQKYERTPRQSDMRRGLLPNHQIYNKVFGTLNRARQLAGIPVLLRVGGYRNYEEAMIKINDKLLKN